MIKKVINIKRHISFNTTGDTWGCVYGINSSGETEYYTGQTTSDSYIGSIPILLISNIDDIGFYNHVADEWQVGIYYNSGNTVYYAENTYICLIPHISNTSFNNTYWHVTPNNNTSEHIVTYTGETRINEFRRYGKTSDDYDLYNPDWNSGFTYTIKTSNGVTMKIVNERDKINGIDKQNLYDYKIWVNNNTGNTLNYSDVNNTQSIISYTTSGLTSENSISGPKIKLDYLIGVINEPKINIDVFIDRGSNASFDRHIKLGDVKSLNDLENYGNGYFKIK